MRPSCLEVSEASSGSNITPKIIDVVFSVRISNEVREATHSTGLKQALSIPLLEGNGEACVPGVQQDNLAPVAQTSYLRTLLGNGGG